MKINGKKVVNAKAPLTLEITKSDVSKGSVKPIRSGDDVRYTGNSSYACVCHADG